MSSSDPIDFNADFLDSLEIIERLAYLDQLDEYAADPEATSDERTDYLEELDDASEERKALQALAEEAGDGTIPDWEYGETLIADDYFEDYARQMASDIGAIDENAGWPSTHIDWEAAAASLRMDYTSLTLGGRTFWAR